MILRFDDGQGCACDGYAPICKTCAAARKEENRYRYRYQHWLNRQPQPIEDTAKIERMIELVEIMEREKRARRA